MSLLTHNQLTFNASLVYKANNDDIELIKRVTGDDSIGNEYQLINLDNLFPLLVDSYKQALIRFIEEDKLGACSTIALNKTTKH